MPMLTRRRFVAGAAGAGGAMMLVESVTPPPARGLGPRVMSAPGKTVSVRLVAAERQIGLPCFSERSLPLWTFADGEWPPLIRLNLGDELEASLENRLDQATSIYWHGIRLPNDQDGVPYLVQPPVQPGESFHYRFTPPDAGTFFFHTHLQYGRAAWPWAAGHPRYRWRHDRTLRCRYGTAAAGLADR